MSLTTPNLTPAVLDPAVTAVVNVATPYLSTKVRSIIYSVAGAVVLIATAAAPVVGGTLGVVFVSLAGIAGVVSSILALSHITPAPVGD